MPELFQGLLYAGVPFVVVLTLGILIEQRWTARHAAASAAKERRRHPAASTRSP